MKEKTRNTAKLVAGLLAVIAVAVLAYAIFMGEPTEDGTDRGMWDNAHSYSTSSITIIVAASFLIAVAVMFILLREEYEPLPPTMTPPPPPPPEMRSEEAAPAEKTAGPSDGGRAVPRPPEEVAAEENYLVLRLLTGDERTMFKTVMDSGGEALQKDLIVRTKMSNAKVSRVLEKLEKKGVISKERHGSTNKVRIKLRT